MDAEFTISLIVHAREIVVLVTGFVLLMIDSPVARTVVVACLVLGLIFALAFRVVARKNDPGAMSILHTPPVIQ
jgi:ABC-type bacteriocin/lantibiotic exporter with double-glycine peptidase domain